MIEKKMPERTAIRTSKNEKNGTSVLYQKNAGLSREIREGAKEFLGILFICNEAAAVYGVGAVAMCEAAVPGWLPASLAVSVIVILGALAHGAYRLYESRIRRAKRDRHCRRYGTIGADTICRIMKEGRKDA